MPKCLLVFHRKTHREQTSSICPMSHADKWLYKSTLNMLVKVFENSFTQNFKTEPSIDEYDSVIFLQFLNSYKLYNIISCVLLVKFTHDFLAK